MDDTFFKEKVAIVTGATSGIGKEIAFQLAAKGANVVICGRKQEKGLKTKHEIEEKTGSKVLFEQCDVSQSSQVQAMVNNTTKQFGRLDFAINNAGILNVQVSLLDYPEDAWDNLMNVNLKGTWLCMKYQIPEMLKNGKGAIVNMSSVAGLVGGYRGLVAYSSSKHGIIGLTKSAALEFASKGIRINALCPGTVENSGMLSEVVNITKDPKAALENMPKFYPMRRLPTPTEIANTAIWLCSEDSSFITGSAIPVDGGFLAQ